MTSRLANEHPDATRKSPIARPLVAGVGLLTMALSLVGCASDGRTTLLVTRPEEAGANCQYGGLRLDTGIDANFDGVLSPDEVQSMAYVCNQRVDGRSTASRVVTVGAGAVCEAGGQRIETGFDDDEDGVLEDAEVDASAVVCTGVDGTDGFTSRVRLVAIPSGIGGSACPFGGTRIESGPDTNGDGDLDDTEVDSFQSVCAVQVASSLFLVEQTVENPGANCPQGGSRMRFGFDDDGDSMLEPSELDGTPVYVCNAVILVAGKTSLSVQSAASNAQCTYGGYVLRTGLDDDYDGILAVGEVDSTAVICNGANGFDALVTQTAEAPPACSGAGGFRVRSGLDTDDDGVLDAGEVTANNLLCNGAAVYGLDGRDSLIVQAYVNYTAYCGSGALAIDSGLDDDRDGTLDASEVEQTSYLCDATDGYDGANALVETYYYSGSACLPGDGLLIRTGTDYDDNGYLNGSEYDESILCN